MPYRMRLLLMLSLPALFVAAATLSDEAKPLPRAHAHNDYEHERPLLDALDNGFCSVEADIFLLDGKLLVAHDLKDVKAERTLQALYLDPLLARVKENGGRIYRNGPPLTLLVDFKSPAEETYAVLREVLAQYREMLTEYTNESTETRAVSVIISGNRPFDTIAAESPRFAAIDGRIPDLKRNTNPHLYPMISSSWSPMFKWNGEGEFPEAEREKLKGYVNQAHANGQTLRFWATPDRPEVWQVLHDAGVDYINTDKLKELREFLAK